MRGLQIQKFSAELHIYMKNRNLQQVLTTPWISSAILDIGHGIEPIFEYFGQLNFTVTQFLCAIPRSERIK
jgi:hypothetical protein